MSNIPLLINGKYISEDGSSHDTYSEAFAANLRLAERKRQYGKISNPWNAVDLLDENDISFITYALSIIWFLALCILGYNHHWWRFTGVFALFIPILLLEILVQRIPKTFRTLFFLVSVITTLLLILYMRLK